MTSPIHNKHTNLKKPPGGKFHRNEWAIMGASCGYIQELAKKITITCQDLSFAYIDAAHGSPKMGVPFTVHYTDSIGSHVFEMHSQHIEWEFRQYLQSTDVAIVNGNHFSANKQIVIIHPDKKESLRKKLNKLTDVQCFILSDGEEGIYSYLIEYDSAFKNLPVFQSTDIFNIAQFIMDQYRSHLPIIKGLVLAGGKSSRMGMDKAFIQYHGKPQVEFIADVLSTICTETFISVANGSKSHYGYGNIEDSFTGLGPYGGILSAFRSDPDAAWLTVATDIPLLNFETIEMLVNNRNSGKVATCFHNPETGFPEPLITLWEPRAYPRLLHFLSLGYSCPRKVLINSDIEELEIENPKLLLNANTPEEKDEILKMMGK